MQKARHPKAKSLVHQKLFTALKSFADLEQRIADLPNEQAKGDAFEVFAEAYLATQRKHDAVEVWPLSAVPLNLLEKLGLTTNDYGVDGILQTTLGQLNVYQVKFRSGRQPLTWRELSTFMGLADSASIHSRVLFTNCDDFRERVEVLGTRLTLNDLRNGITTKCIEILADNWEERFGELQAFKASFGHCNVPQKWQSNPRLAGWVGTQRQLKKASRLIPVRNRRLEELGFIWSPTAWEWEKGFQALLQYKRMYGHCEVPAKCHEHQELGTWAVSIRQAKKDRTLSHERIKRLEEVGFTWDVIAVKWDRMFDALRQYRAKFGNCKVPANWPENLRLAFWVGAQRGAKKLGKLSADRTRRLEELGFTWDTAKDAWHEMLVALIQFKHKHGHCAVPQKNPENLQLGRWVLVQRRANQEGILSEDRRRQLEAVNFLWKHHDGFWEQMFETLLAYQRRFGHCNVPIRGPENPKLGTWVFNQRRSKKTGDLVLERIERLNAIGFIWGARDLLWDEMFRALMKFKRDHGHCNVSKDWAGNPKLGSWVSWQRHLYKKGKLSVVRVRRLPEIGFEWEATNGTNKK